MRSAALNRPDIADQCRARFNYAPQPAYHHHHPRPATIFTVIAMITTLKKKAIRL